MIKRSILQWDIATFNVCMYLKYSIKLCEAKTNGITKEVNECTMIVGDFKTLLSEMDRYSRQKNSKDTVELNNIINQLNIIDIYTLLIQQQ